MSSDEYLGTVSHGSFGQGRDHSDPILAHLTGNSTDDIEGSKRVDMNHHPHVTDSTQDTTLRPIVTYGVWGA